MVKSGRRSRPSLASLIAGTRRVGPKDVRFAYITFGVNTDSVTRTWDDLLRPLGQNLANRQARQYYDEDNTNHFMATAFVRQRVPPKRISLAEHDPVVAETIRMALAVDNHWVDIAEDGRRALGMFDSAKYDLVITDFTMPNMDGLELAEALKRTQKAFACNTDHPAHGISRAHQRERCNGLKCRRSAGQAVLDCRALGSLLKLFPSS